MCKEGDVVACVPADIVLPERLDFMENEIKLNDKTRNIHKSRKHFDPKGSITDLERLWIDLALNEQFAIGYGINLK